MITNRTQITTPWSHYGRLALMGAVASLLCAVSGCETANRLTGDPITVSTEDSGESSITLQPEDFAAETSSGLEAFVPNSTTKNNPPDSPNTTTADVKTATTNPQNNAVSLSVNPGRALYVASAQPGVPVTVAGLVGQVNGRPIYVDDVFAPIADRLALMANEMSYDEFAQKALILIAQRVRQMVENELLLAEAMGQLTAPQQEGLLHYLRTIESSLVREGGGSAEVAERRMLENEGITLDERVDQFRDEILIREQLQKEIQAKITVTWREIQRYYRDHPHEFNPPAAIQLRILAIARENTRKQAEVEAALAAGRPFELVVEEYADLMAGTAGLLDPIELPNGRKGANLTVWPQVNAAVENLAVGTPAGPFLEENYAVWVQIEQYEDGAPIPLRDAQMAIEMKLREMRFAEESEKYFQKLRSRGNFDDLEMMATSLLAVALDRWGPTE